MLAADNHAACVPHCIGRSIPSGNLTAVQSTAIYGYDTLGRLTGGPLGSYAYGDSAHVHAATAIGASWTASYDAAGDMSCRAPDATTTCAGPSPTGAQLSYDAEGSLVAWQNAPASPATTDAFLYDGQGNRVEQQLATAGASTTTTTTYYYAADIRVALAVNGTFSYLGDDVLGSSTTAFDASGAAQASQLYAPYGGVRYATGTMPGSFGFTGQRSDAATGLDYYVSRYYDPVAGQFISADTVLGSNGADPFELSRYAYVEGNPESKTDPTGHCPWCITAVIGAVVGAAVGAVGSVAAQQAAGHCCDWGNVAGEAAVGALSGAITGALGPMGGAVTTMLVHGAVGALVGAGSQLASNAIEGKPLGDGVLLSAAIGGVSGGISGAMAARQAARAASGMARAASRDVGAAAKCLLSFSPDTPVATPNGEQAIGTLRAGDQVTAYDPQTGQSSSQTVEHVWINHDTDLIDLTLHVASDSTAPARADASGKQQDAELAAHGLRAPPADEQIARQARDTRESQRAAGKTTARSGGTTVRVTDETVHTTAKHPWLTADRGWVKAGQLRVGERVVRLDGTTAVVAAERAVLGAADYYNLTVSRLHTFAVGEGQYVVHNCGGAVRYGSTKLSEAVQAARTLARDRGGNYAAAELEDGTILTAKSTVQRVAGKKITIHAEQTLIEKAEGRASRIVSLYSEREPCAARCMPDLLQHNPGMDITWTWKHNFPGISNPQLGRLTSAVTRAITRKTFGLF